MSTSRFSSAKEQQIVVVCDSASIATCDISGVLSSLKSLSGDRSSAMGAEGAVTLVFNGYDDDPRELESIPEVREWFAKLFEAWPYWSFFACRIDQTVPLVLTLLLPGEATTPEASRSPPPAGLVVCAHRDTGLYGARESLHSCAPLASSICSDPPLRSTA